ncbi:protein DETOXIFICATION 29-like [Prunus yedoensis var. nudiflora]|uniref:Protein DETOXIFICATION 29-like n=1 Tax=Prunus yedoensis var. nudiflora TaxID=2094558 RepID=A0A314V1T8_PRUYE|nr:protein DETOXIFICATION 29-like [Prunus yedoensis var. nudiflora]
MEDKKQPLLSPRDEFGDADRDQLHDHLESFPATAHPSFTSNASFAPDADDIPPILGFRDFFREFYKETKKLWYLAGPAIFTSICQYSLGAITQVFAGQVGTLELAAVSIENSVIAGFSFGVMVPWNGECAGDAVRASVRGGTAGHVRDIHAEVMGDPELDGRALVLSIHLRPTAAPADRADRRHIEGGGSVRHLDDTAAVRVRHEFPDSEVPAVAEQDHGDGGHSRGGSGSAHGVQLAVDAEAGVGPGGWGRGAERVLVVNRVGTVGLHLFRDLWSSVGWVLVEGVSESLEFCEAVSRFCNHALQHN